MQENVRDDGWIERVYDKDTPADNFGVFDPIVALWNSKRLSGDLPAWRDFSFEDFANWYGWLCVFDIVEKQPFDLRIRLWGTHIVELLGYDPTGRSMRLNDTPPYEYEGGYEQADIDFLHEVSQKPAIGYGIGSLFWQNREYVQYEDIFVPLADDGKTVDKLLNVTSVLPGSI